MSHPTQRSKRRQMARAVALLFFLTPKIAFAAAKPLMQRSSDAYKIQTTQAEVSAEAEENADVDAAPVEGRTVLFDLSGNAIGEFAGTFLDVTPDRTKCDRLFCFGVMLLPIRHQWNRISCFKGTFPGVDT